MGQFKKKGEAMKVGAFVVAAGLVLPASAALAAQSTLAGDELRKAISGKTVYLNVSGFELPIRYAANGRMFGRMDGKTYCYKLTRNGSTVQWVRNDGRSGTARISG